MKTLEEILKRPLVTEKSSAMRAESNKVVFEVARAANKKEIKSAVEKMFETKVTNVSTMIILGKPKRLGSSIGRRKTWKKAIVTLAEGADIDIFAGLEAPIGDEE